MAQPQISASSAASQLAATITHLHSPAFPAALCRWLHACFSHDNITILTYFPHTPPELLTFASQHPHVHKNITKDYLTGAYLLDPFYDLYLKRRPAGVYRLSDIAPDNFHRSRYFISYYRQTTMSDEIGFILYPSANISIHICLGKDPESGTRFTKQEMATGKRIFPIVAALATSHWKMLYREKGRKPRPKPPRLVDIVTQKLGIHLSPRQADVAMLILQGHSSASIGLRLGISEQTVKVFRKQLYKKCEISSQAELFSLMFPIMSLLQ